MSDDPEAKALLERWSEAIERYQGHLHEHELKDILDFQGPLQMDADLRQRLEASAQGKLKDLVSQITPFFDTLQQMLLLFTVVMPKWSLPMTLVSGGAYLTVKKCAQFDTASKQIVEILDQIKKQLILFQKYSETLNLKEGCREGLVRMFIAMIKFWVATVRFLSRNSPEESDNWILNTRWPVLHQKFLIALQEIEEAVRFVHQLQDAEKNSWAGGASKAQSKVLEKLPDTDLSEAMFPCHELPTFDKSFVGRADQLNETCKALKDRSISPAHTVITSGLGGVGKSALALTAAHRCRTEGLFDSILWLNAENADVLRESFTRIALRLLLKGATDKSDKERNFMLVKNWLDKTTRSWLLIYDNVDDYKLLDEYLPPDTGCTIITTRFQHVSFAIQSTPTRIQLGKFSPEDSLSLFNSLRVLRHPQADIDNEKEETKELLDLIDGLALGIKQMAFYIASKKLTIKQFQQKYNKMARYVLEHQSISTSHTLGTLWGVQFEDIRDSNSSKLLGILSLCGPENIPLELFELEEPMEDVAAAWADLCENEAEVEQAIDDLYNKALIDREEGASAVSLHRLTQEAFLYSQYGLRDTKDLQQAFDALVALLDRRFPEYGREKSLLDDWAICSRYLPHISALARVFRSFSTVKLATKRLHTSQKFASILARATWYLQEIGELRECSDLLQVATDACEDTRSLTYAYLCNTHVVVAIDQNNMAEGQLYSEKAIDIRTTKLGPDDLDLAISYGNYASSLLNEGKFDDALANHALSDSIWTDTGRDDEVYRGLSYLNVGRVHSLKGDAPAAISYFKKAEAIFSGLPNKMFFIGVHYTWATLLMNQGDLLSALGRFQTAYRLAKDAIPYQVVMSAIHYKIAVLQLKLGLSYEEAKTNLRSAMTIATYHQREGEIARIGKQLASALRNSPAPTAEEIREADELSIEAKQTKDRMWNDIETHIGRKVHDEEEQFDWLVAAWYR